MIKYLPVQRNSIFLSCCVLICLSIGSFAQQINRVKGVWKGNAVIEGKSTDMTFQITETNGVLDAKLSLSTQGGTDYPSTRMDVKGDSVLIGFHLLHARYKGVIHKDSAVITGMWEQHHGLFPLRLIQGTPPPVLKRPQEPKPPFPYKAEEVIIDNVHDGVKLAGTLTMPSERKAFAAVVLITGSGPQDRNEEILGHKPFLLIADYFTRQGIAVLRYDDRGTAKSTGNFSASTTADFANDAEAAIAFLQTRKEIDPHKIGLLGHSEGGMIAPMIASRNKDVAFIVLMAGPGLKGSDLLLLQTAGVARSMGASDMQIALASGMNKKIYAWAQLEGTAGTDSITVFLIKSGQSKEVAEKNAKIATSAWLKYFLALDPAPYLSKVTCPVLAINGTKDIQVPCKEDLEVIRTNLEKAGNKHFTIHEFEGLNHLFQHCIKCTVGEYGTLEETMDPEVLKYMGDWLKTYK